MGQKFDTVLCLRQLRDGGVQLRIGGVHQHIGLFVLIILKLTFHAMCPVTRQKQLLQQSADLVPRNFYKSIEKMPGVHWAVLAAGRQIQIKKQM